MGRDTYVRLYPNPGFCLCLGGYRLAVSLHGGIEMFRRHPKVVWLRVWHLWSRVKRPGGE